MSNVVDLDAIRNRRMSRAGVERVYRDIYPRHWHHYCQPVHMRVTLSRDCSTCPRCGKDQQRPPPGAA